MSIAPVDVPKQPMFVITEVIVIGFVGCVTVTTCVCVHPWMSVITKVSFPAATLLKSSFVDPLFHK